MIRYPFNGLNLSHVDKIKYIVMYIDTSLSWNYHIQHLSAKLSRANGILSKLRHNAPLKTCLQVYYAIFYSHLIYGYNIWGLTSEEILNKIEVLQRKCLRIITVSDFNSHSHTNPLVINLKLLKVKYLIKLHQLKLVFEFYEQVIPTALFTFSSDMHTTNLVYIPGGGIHFQQRHAYHQPCFEKCSEKPSLHPSYQDDYIWL